MERLLLFSLFSLFFYPTSFAQSISNISASTKDGSAIRITYTLHNVDEVHLGVFLKVSTDGGLSFFNPNGVVYGDIGEEAEEGSNEIIWEVLDSSDSFVSDKVIFKLFGYPSSYNDDSYFSFNGGIYINGQVWMKMSLDHSTISGSWWLDKYDTRVYDWQTAKEVCPKGWRLPSKRDFELLLQTAGGTGEAAYDFLNSNREGEAFGLDTYFFRSSDGKISEDDGLLWTSTEVSNSAYAFSFNWCPKYYLRFVYASKDTGIPVRCILNESALLTAISEPLVFILIKGEPDIQTMKPYLYVKWLMERKINDWKVKGEFEKTIDYEKRITSQLTKTKMIEFAEEALNQLKSRYTKQINWDQCHLNPYDADKEIFHISSKQLGDFFFKVPIIEAPSFKDNWVNLQIVAIDYCPTGEKLKLAKLSMKNPKNGKVYLYDNKSPTTFDYTAFIF